jgi:flagellar basal body P-ring formation protein FlgA
MSTYKRLSISALAAVLLMLQPCLAANAEAPKHDLSEIRSLAKEFLLQKLGEQEGKGSAEVGPLDQRLNLSKCSTISVNLSPGSALIGRTTLSVSCTYPEKWNIFIVARTSLVAKYIVAARPIVPGATIQEDDITFAEGDLAKLPPRVARVGTEIIGLSSSNPIRKGDAIRTDSVAQPVAFQAGQQVKLVATSAGFSVSGNAVAINTARIGSIGEARTSNGQRVSGVATSVGVLEIKL